MAAKNQAPKKGSGDILIIACGALSHEIIALNQLNQWDCFTVECIPARIHWAPKKIPATVREKIHACRDRFEKIYVAFGDCGTGGELDKVLAEENIERIDGPHCFSFMAGNDFFNNDHEKGKGATTLYLTDFFLKHYEKFFVPNLGYDKYPELQEMYFSNYTTLMYTAQVKNEKLEEKAQAIARQLNLDYQYHFSGYGDLATFMNNNAHPVIPISQSSY